MGSWVHLSQVVALANLHPADDNTDELDSHMFQTVGHHAVSACAAWMGVPLLRRRGRGKSLQVRTLAMLCARWFREPPVLRLPHALEH